MNIWSREGGNLTTTNVKSHQPFNEIFNGLEIYFPENLIKRCDLIAEMTVY